MHQVIAIITIYLVGSVVVFDTVLSIYLVIQFAVAVFFIFPKKKTLKSCHFPCFFGISKYRCKSYIARPT